jgi:hypothetical protein
MKCALGELWFFITSIRGGIIMTSEDSAGLLDNCQGERDKILESRPGKDGLSWPVKPPEKEKL